MTVELDEADARIEKLKQQTRKVIFDIDNFDVETRPITELNDLFKVLEILKEKVEDEMDMIAVEDFLLHGAGIKNKNI
jgi:hypothetical protein